ncbi:hypothetical protein B0H17DRAFT_1333162 [Mycena rosella]|uniref:Glycosyltransferase family 1 protein n=1 Tax=Mycena rosella TaxID=1033263 RepID=A0AAD7DBR5_MYCRO|nr:hypothetical protein B0H17DRAFT_1333162 [Mycena rosella]
MTLVQHNIVDGSGAADVQARRSRLRIIGVGDKHIPFKPDVIKQAIGQLIGGWIEALPQLVEGSEGWPEPHTLHMDFIIGGFVIEPTKQIVTLAWNGTDTLSGRVVKYPGAPDMYDHERLAYGSGPADGLSQLLVAAQGFAKVVDGYIAPSATCFEPVGVPYCREMYQKRGQELFTVGLQAHELCWTDVAAAPPTNEIVKSFLDTAVGQYGAKSVLYISFGSLFFPIATPELIEALVDTLLASLPTELIQRVNTSGKGLICDFWVEQRAILQHSAVGWFLTHGGFNSISESLSQGIPLIVWPTNAEQPIKRCPHFIRNILITPTNQVRTGPHLGPSLRGSKTITGTVEDASAEFKRHIRGCAGPEGDRVAENARQMAKALREARKGETALRIVGDVAYNQRIDEERNGRAYERPPIPQLGVSRLARSASGLNGGTSGPARRFGFDFVTAADVDVEDADDDTGYGRKRRLPASASSTAGIHQRPSTKPSRRGRRRSHTLDKPTPIPCSRPSIIIPLPDPELVDACAGVHVSSIDVAPMQEGGVHTQIVLPIHSLPQHESATVPAALYELPPSTPHEAPGTSNVKRDHTSTSSTRDPQGHTSWTASPAGRSPGGRGRDDCDNAIGSGAVLRDAQAWVGICPS